ncbi:MAG: hypothetical protein EOM51_09150 [Clostridia bacterium]|nr:hypothetical protein [Clostridia bacterium]
MSNLFLTGEVGAGKSTVICKTLALLPPIVCGGFRTVSVPAAQGAALEVYLEKAWEKTPRDLSHLVGTRYGFGRFAAYPTAFNTIGASILSSPPKGAALIIMDELGVMENDAELFCKAVIEALNGKLPVLGVIKPKHTDFLDAVRAHERSEIFMVSDRNREELPEILADKLRKIL